MSGTSLVLTPAAANTAGSAVYPVPEPSSGLTASFTAKLGGGTGGDGLTFSLLNAATEGPTALGGNGANLGFGGLSGDAVTLETDKNAGDPSDNFVGIANGATSGHLDYVATATNVPALRTGSHVIGVSLAAGVVKVTVDGTQYLSTAVSLPPTVLPTFTGATGNGLSATFDAQLSGGSGGDGLTVALLDPAKSSATSVGGTGAELGFGGLAGVAVTLVTRQATGYPGSNFIGISTGLKSPGLLAFQFSARGIQPLRDGTHTVGIKVVSSGGTDVLIVTLDGEQVFQSAEPLLARWGTARLAFTAGTSAVTDTPTPSATPPSPPGDTHPPLTAEQAR